MVVLVMAFGAVVARLADLQIVHAQEWVNLGVAQRTGSQTLPAVRGAIYDRDGRAMALSVPLSTIYADPHLIARPDKVAAKLAPVLGLPAYSLQKKLSAHNRFQFLAHTVPDRVAAKVKKLNLAGIGMYDEFKRYVPSGPMARSVLGQVADGQGGIAGLERQYDSVLAGKDGKLEFERAHGGGTIAGGHQQVIAARPGENLYLTLDESMQYEAEQALLDQVAAMGAKGGTAIVSRPSTGEILAMANVAAAPDGKVGPTADNKAVTSTFEPGSVNKVVTMSAALQEGVVTPDTITDVPAGVQVADHFFTDAESHGEESWKVPDILATSSNVGTIKIARQLGATKEDEYLKRFGLASTTGLGFPGESGGILPALKDWSGTSIGSIPIGQGIAVTALQMLSAFNVVANDGQYVAPKLVAATSLHGAKRSTPMSANHRVLSTLTAREMRAMLTEVVRSGTGHAAAVPGYDVYGKTGTARIPQPVAHDGNGYMDANGHYHYDATFVGGIDGGDLSIIVVLNEP
ncbi:MAG TPA: penicillin-binding protein 2, partial [Acidimicrobiales bacterium]